jgi:hypothetical protein
MANISASPFTGNVVSIAGAQRESRICRLRFDLEACLHKSRRLREAPEMTALLDFRISPIKSLLQGDLFADFFGNRLEQSTEQGKLLGKSMECTCLRRRKKTKNLGQPSGLINTTILQGNKTPTDVGRIQDMPGTGDLKSNKPPSISMGFQSSQVEDVPRIRIVRVESLSISGMNGSYSHAGNKSRSPGAIVTSTIHTDEYLPPRSLYPASGGANGNSIGSASFTQNSINRPPPSTAFTPSFSGVNKRSPAFESLRTMPPLLQQFAIVPKKGPCFNQQTTQFNSLASPSNGEVFSFNTVGVERGPVTIYSPTLSPAPLKGQSPCIHMISPGNSEGLAMTKPSEMLPFGRVCGQENKLYARSMLPLAKKPRCEDSHVRRISVSSQ